MVNNPTQFNAGMPQMNRFIQPTPLWNYGMQEPQPQMQASPSSFIWVQGEAGAKSYPVGPGNKVALFDSESPTVYIKEVDVNGRPLEMETYDLVKREAPSIKQEPQIDVSNFVTKGEIEPIIASSVKAEIERAMSEISLKPTSKKKKGDDE